MSLTLEVMNGPCAGQKLICSGTGTILIGRSERCTFAIRFTKNPDTHLSKKHALIEVNGGRARIWDLGSHNGTFVNDKLITAYRTLHDCDEIRVGETSLVAHLSGENLEPLTPKVANQVPLVNGFYNWKLIHPGKQLWSAMRNADNKKVSLRVLPLQKDVPEEAKKQFLEKMAELQSLRHPYVERIYGVHRIDSGLMIESKPIKETSLRDYLLENRKKPVTFWLSIAGQILSGLKFLHRRGIVHGNLRPSNVYLHRGEKTYIKMADIGWPQWYVDHQLGGSEFASENKHTKGFLAPEQIVDSAKTNEQSDIYAVAANLYFFLTGRMVYELPRNPLKQLLYILRKDPTSIRAYRPDLPTGLISMIFHGLSRDPARRFQSASDFRHELRPFVKRKA